MGGRGRTGHSGAGTAEDDFGADELDDGAVGSGTLSASAWQGSGGCSASWPPPHSDPPPTMNLMEARVVPGLEGSGSVPAVSPSTWKNSRRPRTTAGSWLRCS